MLENFNVDDLIDILLKRLWLIITISVIFGVGSFLYSTFFMTELYTSSTSMYVYNPKDQNTQVNANDFALSAKLVNTYMVIIKSDPVLEAVAEKVNLHYSPAQINTMLNLAPVNNTEVFNISVTNPNPEHAMLIAQTIAEIAPAELKRVVKAGAVEIVNVAKKPQARSYPNITNNTIIGFIVGLVLSFLILFLIEMLNTLVKNEDDLSGRYNLPVLGSIPDLR